MDPRSQGGALKQRLPPAAFSHAFGVKNDSRCALNADKDVRAPRSLIFQYRFSVYRDLDDVANDDAALIHRVVPTDAKVLPIDRSFGDEAGAGLWAFVDAVFPPGCLPLTEVANVEDSRSRDPANR